MTADDLNPLRAEVARLRAWKQEAMTLFDGLQDLGRALDLPLGVLVTGPLAIEAAEALRAERDTAYERGLAEGGARVRERVEAVDLTSRRLGMAFPDPWREGWNRALDVAQADLRAALADADRDRQPHIANQDAAGGFSCSCGHSDPELCPYEGKR